MIQNLRIERYKSIRELELSCKRINIFVGAPDTGKTNILEAMGLWCPQLWGDVKQWLRVEQAPQLFHDLDSEIPIRTSCDGWTAEVSRGHASSSEWRLDYRGTDAPPGQVVGHRTFDSRLNVQPARGKIPEHCSVKFYTFDRKAPLNGTSVGGFEPVNGSNLAALLLSSKTLRQQISQLAPPGFQIQVTPHENKVTFGRDADGVWISHPYSALSETIRRLIFHTLILETNKDCTIVLDEPEAHTFPVYTKLMAERMASYSPTLQFFLTTHSPFMLLSLIEKTPVDDLNVVYCRMEDFQTKAYPLNQSQLSRILDWDMDSFFNFDRLIEDE